MLKIFFLIVIFIHGIIHLLGFLKGFQLAEINQLTQNITKPIGLFWLLALILFIAASIQFLSNYDLWGITVLAAVILSQILIIMSWQDAKYGTIPNVLILIVVIFSIAIFITKNEYRNAIQQNFKVNNDLSSVLLTESDIAHLPVPVQNYIKCSGSIGKPKISNFKVTFSGGIRSNANEEFMQLKSEQYNFIKNPARLFYIEAKKMNIPAIGLHIYQDKKAIFKIKILGLFTVVDAFGDKMDQGETVTLFNDMCCVAPASLIDNRINWQTIDSLSVKAVFTNGSISVSAILYFNERGELVNFISNDRYDTDGKKYKNYPWSTPILAYKNINGYHLPSRAKLIYSREDGEFVYGDFKLQDVKYNLSQYED